MNKSPTLASFWTSATCLMWNPQTKHCKPSIWVAWENPRMPAIKLWLSRNVTSSGQSFSRCRPPGRKTDAKTKGKVDLTVLKIGRFEGILEMNWKTCVKLNKKLECQASKSHLWSTPGSEYGFCQSEWIILAFVHY
jgi:hypothetical protein